MIATGLHKSIQVGRNDFEFPFLLFFLHGMARRLLEAFFVFIGIMCRARLSKARVLIFAAALRWVFLGVLDILSFMHMSRLGFQVDSQKGWSYRLRSKGLQKKFQAWL